jgi:hypothetical protein
MAVTQAHRHASHDGGSVRSAVALPVFEIMRFAPIGVKANRDAAAKIDVGRLL